MREHRKWRKFEEVLKLSFKNLYTELLYPSFFFQGAVENLLERSISVQLEDGSVVPLDENTKRVILDTLHDMSSSALRCLGFAYKTELDQFATYDGEEHPAHKLLLDPSNYASIESDLVFVGLAGLRVSIGYLHIMLHFPFQMTNFLWFHLLK
jgi:magnesium-transporting ATPase (P-type)